MSKKEKRIAREEKQFLQDLVTQSLTGKTIGQAIAFLQNVHPWGNNLKDLSNGAMVDMPIKYVSLISFGLSGLYIKLFYDRDRYIAVSTQSYTEGTVEDTWMGMFIVRQVDWMAS